MPSSTSQRKKRQSSLEATIAGYYSDPEKFVREVIKPTEIQPEQSALLQAIAGNPMVSARSGHGVGKTTSIAWAILWFMFTRVNARVPCTAPTQRQLFSVLWPEINRWMNNSAILKQVFNWKKTKLEMRTHEATWFAYCIASNRDTNMQGIHGDNLLFVVDEASGVPDPIFAAIEGSLTKAENRLVLVGNPNLNHGYFYNSHTRDKKQFKTLHFDSEKSKLTSEKFIKRMARYGVDSDIYLVRVKGEFPKGQPDTLIRVAAVMPAVGREIEEVRRPRISIGVDPARFGDDDSIICVREDMRILPMVPGETAFHGLDTQQVAGQVLRIVRTYRGEGHRGTIQVRIDDTGVGGGVTDSLRHAAEANPHLDIEVIPIIFNAAPTISDYDDYGSQMWGNIRDLLPMLSLPEDDDLIAQLTTRKYKLTPDGRIRLERKEDMKKRQLPSPDRADALGLACADVDAETFVNAPVVETERRTLDDKARGEAFAEHFAGLEVGSHRDDDEGEDDDFFRR